MATDLQNLDVTPVECRVRPCDEGPNAFTFCWTDEDEDDLVTPAWQASDIGMSSFDLSGYGEIMLQVQALIAGDEADEYGILRPTDYAVSITENVLRDALAETIHQARRAFPRGTVTSDARGGLRIEWESENRAVRLAVSHADDGRSYIYHEHGVQYETTERLTGGELADRLQALLVSA